MGRTNRSEREGGVAKLPEPLVLSYTALFITSFLKSNKGGLACSDLKPSQWQSQNQNARVLIAKKTLL